MPIETDLFKFADQLHRVLNENKGLTIEMFAEKLGKSPQWLRDRLQLRNLHPALQKLVREERFPLQYAIQLSYKPPERQLVKAKATLGIEVEIEASSDSVHQLSLFVTEFKGPGLSNFIELIGQPSSIELVEHKKRTAAICGWRFGDAGQLVRAMGYANRLRLLGGLPNTFRAEAR